MASNEHNKLVELGAKWLKQRGFAVVATELQASGCREQADVVGFRAACSAIVEVKVSRSDFLADAKKPHRTGEATGIGTYRFFMCPHGLIEEKDLPAGWGLLWALGNTVSEIVGPKGNVWSPYGSEFWAQWQHASSLEAERAVLFSIARRTALENKKLKGKAT